jgi:hypothetical protein
VIADCIAGDIVAAAADSQQKIVRSRKIDGTDHVGHAIAASDQRWPSVDHAVPDLSSVVVACVFRLEEWTAQTRFEILNGAWVNHLLIRHRESPFTISDRKP